MLTWRDIVGLLENISCEVIREKQIEQEFCSFCFLKPGMSAKEPDCIYLANESDLPFVEVGRGCSLILFGIPGDAGRKALRMTANCAYIGDVREKDAALADISAGFGRQFEAGKMMYTLYGALKNDVGLHKMVNILAEFTGLPVSVMDNTFRFLAKSSNYVPQSDDPLIQKGHRGKSLPEPVLKELKRRGIFGDLLDSKEIFYLEYRGDSVYFIPILINNVKVGYITVYENTDRMREVLDRALLKYLPLFAGIFSFELAKKDFYASHRGSYYSYIFSMLLEEENTDTEEIRLRLQALNYDLLEDIYLINMDLSSVNLSERKKSTIAGTFQMLFRNSIYICRIHSVLFLMSRRKGEPFSDVEWEIWERHLQENGIKAAMTGPFSDFHDFKSRLKETEMLLRAGKKRMDGKSLYLFSEYQTDVMLEYIDDRDLKKFCFRPVMKLSEYDRKHGTELIRTLRLYLNRTGDIAGICAELCVHKNTLYKRMNRIRSVSGCGFDSAEDIMRTQITFHILEKSGEL